MGPTSVGPNSVVARNALVARSVLWSGCSVGEGAIVHGSVLADDAWVPSATRLFNVVRQQPARLSPRLLPAHGTRATSLPPPGATCAGGLPGPVPTCAIS